MSDPLITIRDHLIHHENLMVAQIDDLLARFKAHPEIATECAEYLQNQHFPANPISVNGYTASDLAKISPMKAFWCYEFLLVLAEDPALAAEIINSKFITR